MDRSKGGRHGNSRPDLSIGCFLFFDEGQPLGLEAVLEVMQEMRHMVYPWPILISLYAQTCLTPITIVRRQRRHHETHRHVAICPLGFQTFVLGSTIAGGISVAYTNT
jgi:hypothetical protein